MLTGVFEPTTGKAYVNGRSITDDMPEIRKSMGFCPQYDILYDLYVHCQHTILLFSYRERNQNPYLSCYSMTVEEHLEFYLKLKSKNITNEEVKKERNQ